MEQGEREAHPEQAQQCNREKLGEQRRMQQL